MKCELDETGDRTQESPLVRGEWIEMIKRNKTTKEDKSPLVRGEWIEMDKTKDETEDAASLPS